MHRGTVLGKIPPKMVIPGQKARTRRSGTYRQSRTTPAGVGLRSNHCGPAQGQMTRTVAYLTPFAPKRINGSLSCMSKVSMSLPSVSRTSARERVLLPAEACRKNNLAAEAATNLFRTSAEATDALRCLGPNGEMIRSPPSSSEADHSLGILIRWIPLAGQRTIG